MQKSVLIGLILVSGWTSACVPSSQYNDLQTHAEKLTWELERESDRNQALQTYVDMILKGNQQIQHPLIYRKPIRTDAYGWNPERLDQVYNPYYLSASTGKWVPAEIPGSLRVRRQGNSFVFELENRLLFAKGSIELLPESLPELSQLSTTLKNRNDYILQIEGHATKEEVWNHPQWKDSWTLSVMRAVEIARKLTEAGIPPQRLITSGRGEYAPLSTASLLPANPLNQRVEILYSPVEISP